MRWIRTATAIALTTTSAGVAQPPADGRAIAAEANRRATGFGDFSAELRMVIRGKEGDERTRELMIRTLNHGDGEERTVVRFHAPRDLRRTALLSVTHTDGSSDQWLYLPALQRVNRIVGAGRTGSFMGSEFAYEDVGAMGVDQYTYRLVGTETLDGLLVWVVERRPKDSASQYLRQVVWYDQEQYRVLRIDYFDRRDALLKTLRLRGFRQYQTRFWRPDEMEMINHQTGASTILTWQKYVFGIGLTARDFEPGRLDRGG